METERRFNEAWGVMIDPTMAIRLEERDDAPPVIRGMAAVFYREDVPGSEYQLTDKITERIAPEAFDRALERQDAVVGLFNHDSANILGSTRAGSLTLTKTRRGLAYEITTDPTDPDHQRVLPKIRRGDLYGSSFQFQIEDQSFEPRGEEGEGVIRTIRSVKLIDVGPVTFPAYEATSIAVRDQADKAVLSWIEAAAVIHAHAPAGIRAERARRVVAELVNIRLRTR